MFPLQEIDMARKIMYLAIYYGKIGTNRTEKINFDFLKITIALKNVKTRNILLSMMEITESVHKGFIIKWVDMREKEEKQY